jgi:hypothetical protein
VIRRRILNSDTRLRGCSRFTRRGEGLKPPRTKLGQIFLSFPLFQPIYTYKGVSYFHGAPWWRKSCE